jgi:hypothetical protein
MDAVILETKLTQKKYIKDAKTRDPKTERKSIDKDPGAHQRKNKEHKVKLFMDRYGEIAIDVKRPGSMKQSSKKQATHK